MKDTLETNLPEEAGKLEETKKPVETPEIDATADVEANDTAAVPVNHSGQIHESTLNGNVCNVVD